MSKKIEQPAYWGVIPAPVRYDDRLPANAKLLFGESKVTSLLFRMRNELRQFLEKEGIML